MKTLLQKHLHNEIGINLERPLKIEPVELVELHQEYFTVRDYRKDHFHHFPYASVIRVIEGKDGIDIHGLFVHDQHFDVIIKVQHVVECTTVA